MFTGLIEDIGIVKKTDNKGTSMGVQIECNFDLTETKIGDSIAIDGICLTVVKLLPKGFEVDVSHETLKRTNLKKIKIGQRVKLERAIRLSDRLGGHLVLGHIDDIGMIRHISKDENSIRLKVRASKDIMKYIIEKGSVAIDGISLTVNECSDNEFGINIIPHTASHTTLGEKKVGDTINIENDIIGKYIEKFLRKEKHKEEEDGKISMEFLHKHGII